MPDSHTVSEVMSQADSLGDRIIRWRRKLHKNPELGLQEIRTTRFIERRLSALGLNTKTDLYGRQAVKEELDGLGEDITDDHAVTGVVAELKGEREGKTVLLRADMDALGVNESRDSEHLPARQGFRSENLGVMHACGHDAHMAMLLGAAEILTAVKDSVNGTITFLFQPDEERGCGARLIRRSGVVRDVDAVFGLHVWSSIDSGRVMINDGLTFASVDYIWMQISGGGGHSSAPHEAGDPLLAANEIVDALYRMQAREIDSREPSLLGIESFVSESDWGVIPDSARMKGTVRTLDESTRSKMLRRTADIGQRVADLAGLEFAFDSSRIFPPTVNTPREAEVARQAARNIYGSGVFCGSPVLSGEDFAQYLQDVPGAFALLGNRDPQRGSHHPHHSPRFDVDESQLCRGAALYSLIALNFLEQPSDG